MATLRETALRPEDELRAALGLAEDELPRFDPPFLGVGLR